MHLDWLNSKITVEEAESRFMVQDDKIGAELVPFGFINEHWNAFKAEIIEGDELWLFSSSRESWTNNCGKGGICIVRDGVIVKSMNGDKLIGKTTCAKKNNPFFLSKFNKKSNS